MAITRKILPKRATNNEKICKDKLYGITVGIKYYMKTTEQISHCRSCKNSDLELVWKLENSPYGDSFKKTAEEATQVKVETLSLGFCDRCKMLQLLEITDTSSTYNNYLYRSSVTNALNSYYQQVSNRLISDYEIKKDELIVDIGSNDGTFLSNFQNKGYQVIGIEPTLSNAAAAELKGINTLNEYFEADTVEKILGQFGPPKLITVNYTLANIPDLFSFMTSITNLMNENTILSVITGYHPDQYAVNMFEYINHDHLTYLSVESFGSLCRALGLKIIDVHKSEHKGGSIQFVVSLKSSAHKTQSSVGQTLQRETWLGVNTKIFTKKLQVEVEMAGVRLNQMLQTLKVKHLYGVGASISTTYLCNQFGINTKVFKLFDDDTNKIGLFAPGTGTCVEALSNIPSSAESVAIILAWQHSEKLIQRLRELKYLGRIILPLPSPLLLIEPI